MHVLLAFAIALVLISLLGIKFRLMPFITLIGAAFLYGILAGMDPSAIVVAVSTGTGTVFTLLGIVIFCGAVIAEVLRQGAYLSTIVQDIRRIAGRPVYASGAAGYLLSVPLMCSITSFVVLAPVVSSLRGDRPGVKRLLYVAAVAGVLSFVLLYPAPVILAIASALGLSSGEAWQIDAVTLPISLVLLAALCIVASRRDIPDASPAPLADAASAPRWKAWAPIAVPLIFFLAGLLVPGWSVLANINVALLAGLAVALASAPTDLRLEATAKGTRHAGIIIFDLCGAGALGSVIAASQFPSQAYASLSAVLPAIVIPFALAALVQTAQGSRVTTAVVTSGIVGATAMGSDIHPLALVLEICAGCCMISYVSDPFFWLLARVTGDDFTGVVRGYTLPLAAIGVCILMAALIVQASLGGGRLTTIRTRDSQ
ncbi:MAG: GntP family permease, partial [Methanobacteriota archaeon]